MKPFKKESLSFYLFQNVGINTHTDMYTPEHLKKILLAIHTYVLHIYVQTDVIHTT